MKNKIIIILLITFQFSFAQKKDENIGTEVVNVVKPYTPTISDAFKVKEIPSLNDNETSKKEEVKYQIFSFPVASTFTPSKGKAAVLIKPNKKSYFLIMRLLVLEITELQMPNCLFLTNWIITNMWAE